MEVFETAIPEVKIIRPVRHEDARGFFCESFNRRDLLALGIGIDFVQDNYLHSAMSGTIRGLHYQLAPSAQDKLLQVVRGSVIDVALDLRAGSTTFGRHVRTLVTAEEGNQILVPAGFAHGFCTLEPETDVIYKVSAYYAPELDRGILWNDPDLGIDWPVGSRDAVLSDRDRRHPRLKDATDLYVSLSRAKR
jgi:dTDP-4-dehydrorhamnose 3,5-epimerase